MSSNRFPYYVSNPLLREPVSYAIGEEEPQTRFFIPPRSMATILKVDTNTRYVSGSVEAEPE